jgi:ABC-2 type transport system permease protein
VSTIAQPAPLRDIGGPSAFGGGLRRFLHLLWLNSLAELKLRYVGSVLGYLWSLIRPLMYFGIIYVAFTQVLRFGEEIPNYAVFLILNLLLFEFFADVTGSAVTSVVSHENLVRKMQFPRLVIPLSVVLTGAFTLCLNLVAAFAIVLAVGVEPRATWLLVPLLLLVLIAFTAGVALILSSLFVRFRDVQHIWAVLSRALLYALPILYPISFVPEGPLRWLVAANPMAPIFEQLQVWVTNPSAPGTIEAAGSTALVLVPLVLLVSIPLFGLWYFDRQAPRIAEEL